MKNIKSKISSLSLALNLSVITAFNSFFNLVAFAAPDEFQLSGSRMQFPKLESLISTIAITLQYFAGGIAIIFVIFNGIKIMTSSDSHRAMEEAKGGMFKVFLGCAVVFLAATIVSLFFKATT